MFGLALAYLRQRPLTTALNILLLAIAVATLVLLLLFSTQLGDRFTRDSKGIDLVVGAKGSPLQLILSSVYQVDVPTGNIPLDSVALLRRDPAVRRVVPLALGDNFRGFRIVGTERGYFDLYGAVLDSGRLNLASGEVVIGARVARETGATLGQQFVGSHGLGDAEGEHGHEQRPFTVVGILKPTGAVIDRLILTSVDTVWDVHGIEHAHDDAHDHQEQAASSTEEAPHLHADEAHEEAAHGDEAHPATTPARRGGFSPLAVREELEPEVTALLVTYRNAAGALRIPTMINRQTELQAAVPAMETARLYALFGSGIAGARVFAWLLAFTGGLSIFVALLNAARAREGDLALLRVKGARRWQVFGTILLEGLITAALGVVAGIAIGHGLLWIAARSFRALEELGIAALRFHPGELAIALAVLAIGVLAATIPAARIFRRDLAETLAHAA